MFFLAFLISSKILGAPPAFSQMSHQHGEMMKEEQEIQKENPSATPLRSMIHGRVFLTQGFIEGPRGENKFAIPNFFMWDAEADHGKNKTFSLSLMLTAEKWTFPKRGEPQLLQIGEENKDKLPYRDAQHPHSSPIMGLTLSESFKIPEKNREWTFSFSPRGEATDGPIVYLNRQSSSLNPDAPLGHHIAQDEGHISSTVFAASLKEGTYRLEASAFNGKEPRPDKVELALGKVDSFAFRASADMLEQYKLMLSVAEVRAEETISRYSASLYYNQKFPSIWMISNTLALGLIKKLDHYSSLRSVLEEFALVSPYLPHNLWGRMEILERGSRQLEVEGPDQIHWIEAYTLGYTYDFIKKEKMRLGLGSSLTWNFIPRSFEAAYGKDPVAGKIIVQLNFNR